MGISETKEQLETLERSFMEIAKQARNEQGQKIFETFRQGEEEVCIASLTRWNTQLKSPAELERQCQGTIQEVKLLIERQEVLKGMVEDEISLEIIAIEKYCEQIFEEMKELQEKKSKEALLLFQKKAHFDTISK